MADLAYQASAHGGIQNLFEMMFGDDLYRAHSRRLSLYRRYWQFYLGKHWSYERDPGEPTTTVNYSKRCLDLHNDFTFKKGFSTVIPDDPGTPEDEKSNREFIRLMLEETWRRNNKFLWGLEAGQMGGVTGDCFVRISWETEDPLEDPYARADIIPSHLCFPEFGGPHGVDRKKLTRIAIVTPVFKYPEQLPAAQYRSRSVGVAAQVTINAEVWTAATYNRDGTIKTPCTVQEYVDGEPSGNPVVSSLGEIPVVHIPNYPLAGEYFGLSDMIDSVEINRELNEKMTDISDIINYHASPQTILYGVKLRDLEKGANRMWAVPADARVENLELDSNLEASNKYIELLRKSLFELTSTPENILGSTTQAISNTTGVALQLQFLPMIAKRDIKVLTYSHGLRLVNRLMIKITELADPDFRMKMKGLKGNKYRNNVVFPDPLPHDELKELEKAIMKIEAGLSARRLELANMGKSQKEIEDILKIIADEQAEDRESEFDWGVSGSGNNPRSTGGPDGTRGEKITNTTIQKNA